MKNTVYIAVSLDGYIAAPDGGLDWLMSLPQPKEGDYGFADFMESVDGIVMGRKTFETVLSFGEWPYTKKVFVLSRTLQQLPEHLSEKAEIAAGEIPSLLDDLHKRGYENLYIDGGKTIQSFLTLDLIDEMIISRVSLLLGAGIPLFGTLEKLLEFRVAETEKLSEKIVMTRYIRERDNSLEEMSND